MLQRIGKRNPKELKKGMENIRMAWESLRVNKMRAILTMLGIIIGIGSVIAILTVGNAMSSSITTSLSALGSMNVTVSIQQRSNNRTFGPRFASGPQVEQKKPEEKDLLSTDMIDAMRQRFNTQIAGISLSEGVGSAQAKEGHLYANINVTGANAEYAMVNNVKMMRGRFISENDVIGTRGVAVVSDKLVNNIFGGDTSSALGKELKVYAGSEIYTYSIIGVYENENSLFNMSTVSEVDITTTLYIPVSVAKRLSGGNRGYQSITVAAVPNLDSVIFSKNLKNYFDKYYENNLDFTDAVTSVKSITDQADTILNNLSIAISVIAGISLLVGGIGVMNIMLVSVTERTREIGIRKALGATNSNIRVQFIVESIIVCLVGGILGVILGGALGYLGSYLLKAPTLPTFSSIALAVIFSMAIGVFFGYYPANKAAKLNPIEALRYE